MQIPCIFYLIWYRFILLDQLWKIFYTRYYFMKKLSSYI